ncbi:hypothetical protein ILUMI_22240, partial [Ignelater luminosus]
LIARGFGVLGTKPSNEQDKQQSLLTEAMHKLRFLTMTPREFTEGPALTNLLTESEKLAIFMNISSPRKTVSMPSGFSTSNTLRNNKQQMYNDNRNRITVINALRISPSGYHIYKM